MQEKTILKTEFPNEKSKIQKYDKYVKDLDTLDFFLHHSLSGINLKKAPSILNNFQLSKIIRDQSECFNLIKKNFDQLAENKLLWFQVKCNSDINKIKTYLV